MRVFANTEEIIEHLEALGTSQSDDNHAFTELDHGLQCAALLASVEPDDLELQIAGLLHDIAHQWDVDGQPQHGVMGAEAVRPVLGDRVANLIAGHVPAKRYLVTTRPEYREVLSAGSITTLAAQGSDMTASEVHEFESQADWRSMVQLRIADDGSKVAGVEVPPLAYWTESIHALQRVSG